MGKHRLLAVSASLLFGSSALAGQVKVACEGESVMIPGWGSGTMNVTFDGGSPGTLAIKGPHTNLSLPATSNKIESANPPSTVISGFGETKAVMPDLAAIDSCVAGKIAPDQKNDPDVYLMTALSCLENAPVGAAPVPIKASAKLGLTPGEDPKTTDTWFEMELSYVDKSASPDGTMKIGLFPKDCKLVP